jgi:hypothetical protein
MIGASSFRSPEAIEKMPMFLEKDFPYRLRNKLLAENTLFTFTADDNGGGEWSSKKIDDPNGQGLLGGSSTELNGVGYFFAPRGRDQMNFLR